MTEYLKNIEDYPVLVTIIIFIFGIIGFFVKGKFFKKDSILRIDFLYSKLDFLSIKKTTSFVYVCDNPLESYACIWFPFLITHKKQTESVKNIRVTIEFPKNNYIDFTKPDLLRISQNEVALVGKYVEKIKQYKIPERLFETAIPLGNRIQVSFEIPFIRKGETIFSDIMFKINNSFKKEKHYVEKNNESNEQKNKAKNLVDNFSVYFSIYAENSQPVHREAKIYCFHGTKEQAWIAIRGYYLKNHNLKLKGKNKKEYWAVSFMKHPLTKFIFILPSLKQEIKEGRDTNVYWEFPEKTRQCVYSFRVLENFIYKFFYGKYD